MTTPVPKLGPSFGKGGLQTTEETTKVVAPHQMAEETTKTVGPQREE